MNIINMEKALCVDICIKTNKKYWTYTNFIESFQEIHVILNNF